MNQFIHLLLIGAIFQRLSPLASSSGDGHPPRAFVSSKAVAVFIKLVDDQRLVCTEQQGGHAETIDLKRISRVEEGEGTDEKGQVRGYLSIHYEREKEEEEEVEKEVDLECEDEEQRHVWTQTLTYLCQRHLPLVTVTVMEEEQQEGSERETTHNLHNAYAYGDVEEDKDAIGFAMFPSTEPDTHSLPFPLSLYSSHPKQNRNVTTHVINYEYTEHNESLEATSISSRRERSKRNGSGSQHGSSGSCSGSGSNCRLSQPIKVNRFEVVDIIESENTSSTKEEEQSLKQDILHSREPLPSTTVDLQHEMEDPQVAKLKQQLHQYQEDNRRLVLSHAKQMMTLQCQLDELRQDFLLLLSIEGQQHHDKTYKKGSRFFAGALQSQLSGRFHTLQSSLSAY